jgi:hypothetical protein
MILNLMSQLNSLEWQPENVPNTSSEVWLIVKDNVTLNFWACEYVDNSIDHGSSNGVLLC